MEKRGKGLTNRLLWKILGIHILIIGFVILLVWLAVDYLAAGYLATLMKKYNVSPTAISSGPAWPPSDWRSPSVFCS
jgi:hypothetical protein